MLPQNVLSTSPRPADFVHVTRARTLPLVDYEFGGDGLNNAGPDGLNVKLWTARYDAGAILVGAGDTPEVVVLTRANVTHIGLAFDQNMQPFLAFADDLGSHFYWFDSYVGAVTTTTLPAGSSYACCTVDEHRALNSLVSDIIIAYTRGNRLYYRQQRDRYTVERLLADPVGGELTGLGMSKGLRLQFRIRPTV